MRRTVSCCALNQPIIGLHALRTITPSSNLQAKQTTFLTTLHENSCTQLHVGEGGPPGTNSCAMLKSMKAAEPLSAIQILSPQMSSKQDPAAWISASACAQQEDILIGIVQLLHDSSSC